MSAKLTKEDINNRLENYNIKLIGEYFHQNYNSEFLCFCGKRFYKIPKNLIRTGGNKSCGCKNDRLFKSLVNKRFGRLVVKEHPYNNDSSRCLCLCDCGKQKDIPSRSLKHGHSTSCGCFRKERAKLMFSGKNHPNYNHNFTEEEREISKKYNRSGSWRNLIFERDNFTCQICSQVGGRLNAHHLDGYNWCKERRLDLNNGITLCKLCHKDFHTKYGLKNNTNSQFEEYRKGRLYA